MRLFWTTALAAMLGFQATSVSGEEESSVRAFQLVVHPESPIRSVSRKFLADTFLKKTTRWTDGSVVRPVDQSPKSDVRRDFSKDVLQRSVSAVKSYWQLAIFSGRDVPPPELLDDEAVIEYVLRNVGGVGYVSENAELGNARVVELE